MHKSPRIFLVIPFAPTLDESPPLSIDRVPIENSPSCLPTKNKRAPLPSAMGPFSPYTHLLLGLNVHNAQIPQ